MKKQKRSKFGLILTISMAVYALIFVCVAYQGFCWFWDFIAAYEKAQPKNTIEAYMQQLDAEHIQDASAELIAGIDHNLQSEESCKKRIAEAVSSGISYSANIKESTETTKVYMLQSGGKTIGKVILSAQPADEFGFTAWVVSEDSFDLSFLIGKGTSITVPHTFPVYANGVLLSENYITESNIPYTMVKDFYDSYQLPYLVTYSVPAIMGDIQLSVTDPEGNAVTQEAWADEAVFLNSCTDAQIESTDGFIKDFLRAYVNYTGNLGKARVANYQALLPYLVVGTPLQVRMYDALDGLRWVPDRYPRILSLDISQRIPTLDGKILCELTYTIRSITNDGKDVDETIHIHLVLTPADNGWQAESMFSS